jgi:hypothetical protein
MNSQKSAVVGGFSIAPSNGSTREIGNGWGSGHRSLKQLF